MSSLLSTLDLTSAGVGFAGKMDFNQFAKFNPQNMVKATIRLLNESGCGLNVVFQASGNAHFLPGGAWGTFDVEPNDATVLVTVMYVLPNPPVSKLFGIYYAPGEPVPQSFTLGNSPIGIGGTVNTSGVQTLSNETNVAGSLVVDIGTSVLANLVNIFNDHFFYKVQQAGVAHTVLQGQSAGNPLLLGQAGDISEVLGQLKVDQALVASTTLAVTGASTLTGGVSGNTTFANNLTVTGTQTFTGAGTHVAALTTNAGIISADNIVTLAGSLGTITLWQPLRGQVKLCVMFLNGYQNTSGSTQGIVPPVAFTGRAVIITHDMPSTGVSFQASGVSQTVALTTGLGGAGTDGTSATTTILHGRNYGEILAGWDTMIIPTGGAGVTSGIILILGN